jgi:hypothetical protein
MEIHRLKIPFALPSHARILEIMRLTSITARIASVAALLAASSSLAQAHPGHFDLSDTHVSSPIIMLSVLAVLTFATAIHRLAPRKR